MPPEENMTRDLGASVESMLEGLDWRVHEKIREIYATFTKNNNGDLVPEIKISIAGAKDK